MMKYASPNVNLKSDFLNALPPKVRENIQSRSAVVTLVSGQTIFSNQGDSFYAYFPLSAVISIQSETEAGATYEVYEIGKEGIVGLPLFLSDMAPPQFAVVCTSGKALRINVEYLIQEFKRGEEFAAHLFRFMNMVVNNVSQSVICGRLHRADQRLCRWLLATVDRTITNQISITHELLANILGVNREFVTLTLRSLRKKALINCGRGLITVVEREQLEKESCECYLVTRKLMTS